MSLTVNIKNLSLLLPPAPAAPPKIDGSLLAALLATKGRSSSRSRTTIDLHARPAAIRIAAGGSYLPTDDTSTPHVAVLYPEYGVMTCPLSLGNDDLTQPQAVEAAEEVRVLGYNDWFLATRPIWERLVLDTSRIDPAVDPMLYPDVKTGLHWTSTLRAKRADEAAGDPAFAWYVSTHGGVVGYNLRDNRGFGLAARFVGQ